MTINNHGRYMAIKSTKYPQEYRSYACFTVKILIFFSIKRNIMHGALFFICGSFTVNFSKKF